MLKKQFSNIQKVTLFSFFIVRIIKISADETGKNDEKREPRDVLNSNNFPTIYYICGLYPNTVYSLTPCQTCRNGGKDLYVGCTNSIQCTPYNRGTTACIDGRCCTSGYEDPTNQYNNNGNPYNGNNPYNSGNNLYNNGNPYHGNNNPYNNGGNNPYNNGGGNPYNPYSDSNNPYYEQGRDFGYCPRGERSNIRCSAPGQCPNAQICMSGMCCPRSNNDYMQACGGQMAITQCNEGTCLDGLICTASNFCCQCPIGRSGGRCNQGSCAPGYKCNLNGYCCDSCPYNQTPFGVCPNQQPCASRFRCSIGDMCCPDNFYNLL